MTLGLMPDTRGLPLTRPAEDAPTLDQDIDEVEETHAHARASAGGTARLLPSAPDGPAGAYPCVSRRVAMMGSDSKGDEVVIGNLKMVNLWSPSEPHIWGALDEGCNSTCHAKAWGDLVDWKLKSFGLSFRWIDGEAKYFTGLVAPLQAP